MPEDWHTKDMLGTKKHQSMNIYVVPIRIKLLVTHFNIFAVGWQNRLPIGKGIILSCITLRKISSTKVIKWILVKATGASVVDFGPPIALVTFASIPAPSFSFFDASISFPFYVSYYPFFCHCRLCLDQVDKDVLSNNFNVLLHQVLNSDEDFYFSSAEAEKA